MKTKDAHSLNSNAEELHLIRGKLMDALEDNFSLFVNCAIPHV